MPQDRKTLLANLSLANKTARAHAALKADLRAGTITIAAALEDDRAASLAIQKLLVAAPGWGPTRAREALQGLRIGELRATGQLTLRQRERIAQVAEEGPQRVRETVTRIIALSPA